MNIFTKFHNFSIGLKISSVVILSVSFLVITGITSILFISITSSNLTDIVNVQVQKIKLGARINLNLVEMSRAEKNLILSKDQTEMNDYAQFIQATQKEMNQRRLELRKLVNTDGKLLLDSFSIVLTKYFSIQNDVIELTRLNSNNKAKKISQNAASEAYNKAAKAIKIIVNKNDRALKSAVSANELKLIGEKIKLGARINRNLVELQRAEKNIILATTQEQMDEYAETILFTSQDLENRENELRNIVTRKNKFQLNDFMAFYEEYKTLNAEVVRLTRQNANFLAFTLSTNEGRELLDKAQVIITTMVDKNEIDINQSSSQSQYNARFMLLFIFVLILITAFISVTISYKVANSITVRLKELVNMADAIATGYIHTEIEIEGKDEASLLAKSMVQMQDNLKEITAIATKVSNGDYSTTIEVENDADDLRIALIEMTQSLKKLSDKNKDSLWLKESINIANNEIRGVYDIYELSNKILNLITKQTDANVGVFYTFNEVENVLELNANHAFTKTGKIKTKLKLGEGLIGQVAADKQLLLVPNIPLGYSKISSAIGSASPNTLLIAPLLLENKIKGVIELGSFNTFTSLQIELIEAITQSLAIAISGIQANQKLETILVKEQNLTTTLKLNETKFLTINNELAEQKKEIQAQNEVLEASSNIEVKNRELLSANRYKSEFISNMSHELRTPLNSLLILSRDLSEDKKLDSKQLKAAKVIYNSGNDLLKLINQVLDIAKVESGKMTLYTEKMDVSGLIEKVITQLKPQIGSKKVNLDFNIAKDVPKNITIDKSKLQQILLNLISNAIKFTLNGSIQVNIWKPKLEDSGLRNRADIDNMLAISVVDTGIGIAKEKQQAIFEAFHQSDGSISRDYGGTGLGLTISKQLAYFLGGELQLSSELGKGATFSLLVPFNTDKDKPVDAYKNSTDLQEAPKVFITKTETTNNPVLEGKLILIIENDEKFANSIKDECVKQKLEYLVTNDGADGLKLAEKHIPRAIILDVILPNINGYDVLEKLKSNLKTRHIPVFVMSANNQKINAMNNGAFDYLVKPISRESIKNSLVKIEAFTSKKIKDLLIVEDHEVTRAMLKKLFTDRDIKIHEAENSQNGIRIIKNTPIDCIILDIGLPDMSGIEMLDTLKTEKDFRMPPVIVYTGLDLNLQDIESLRKHTSIIIPKQKDTDKYLFDKISLFLHRIVDLMEPEKKGIVKALHDENELLKDKNILLVDDDMRNLYALSYVLEQKGMNIIKAENSNQAINVLETENIDMVLMDIMMPGVDGYETMRIIRKQAKYAHLPIIAVTAKSLHIARINSIKAGANDYLVKPIDLQKLLQLMRIWI